MICSGIRKRGNVDQEGAAGGGLDAAEGEREGRWGVPRGHNAAALAMSMCFTISSRHKGLEKEHIWLLPLAALRSSGRSFRRIELFIFLRQEGRGGGIVTLYGRRRKGAPLHSLTHAAFGWTALEPDLLLCLLRFLEARWREGGVDLTLCLDLSGTPQGCEDTQIEQSETAS